MLLLEAKYGQIFMAVLLSVVLASPSSEAGFIFSRKVRCGFVFQKTSKDFVLDFNQDHGDFLNLKDYSEGAYSEYRKIGRNQIKRLDAILNGLNPRRKYTEKEKFDWTKDVVEKVSDLVGENNALRRRAQMEFLRKGLDNYLRESSTQYSLTNQAIYGYNRLMEVAFDNWITRWAAVPVLFPQLRYKDLRFDLLKRILFEGYDKNEKEVMSALKETNRLAAYNKFTVLYRKFLLISALAVAPVAGGFLTEKVMDDASNAIVAQTQETERQSRILKSVDWDPVQESIVFVHAKEDLEKQLGRSLNPEEVQDLKTYISQRF